MTSAKTGLNAGLVFELCAAAADKGAARRSPLQPMPATTAATVIRKLRRPTSLRLNDDSTTTTTATMSSSSYISHRPAATAQRQKQLRLGVSSLIISGSAAHHNQQQQQQPHISRQQQQQYAAATSPFAPYSPQARNNASLLALNTSVFRLHQPHRDSSSAQQQWGPPTPPERPLSSQSAQIRPSRLAGRPSRPPGVRARPRPVLPPTSPDCDIPVACCYSPTASLLSGPLSPTASLLSPFAGGAASSPTSSSSLHPAVASDRESLSSHSQTDSISVREDKARRLFLNTLYTVQYILYFCTYLQRSAVQYITRSFLLILIVSDAFYDIRKNHGPVYVDLIFIIFDYYQGQL